MYATTPKRKSRDIPQWEDEIYYSPYKKTPSEMAEIVFTEDGAMKIQQVRRHKNSPQQKPVGGMIREKGLYAPAIQRIAQAH